MKILDGMARDLAAGAAVDRGDPLAFVGFLAEFADKCHHGKQEGMLFPALKAAGIPAARELVDVLVMEHAQGRDGIGELRASIGETIDAPRFSRAATGYAQLLRAHIRKESEILFPMAERILTAAQLESLFEAFEAHEARVIGVGRHEELHQLLGTLKLRYAR